MFPIKGSGIARPYPTGPRRWVAIAVFVYPDHRVLKEVLEAPGSPQEPLLFQTDQEAIQAAEAYAQTYRLSNKTEILTDVYGGDS